MNKIIKRISSISLCFIILMVAASSCKSAKSATSNNNYSNVSIDKRYETVTSGYATWETFTSSGKIGFSMGDGNAQTMTMQIKMKRGEYISVSLRPLLGIEVGKLYISRDSIIVVDKYHKYYVAEDVSTLTAGIPFSLENLQDVFLNRAFILNQGTLTRYDQGKTTLDKGINGTWSITPKDKVMGHNYSFSFNSDNQLISLTLLDEDGVKPYSVSYGNFIVSANGSWMAQDMLIKIQLGDKVIGLVNNLNLSSCQWNKGSIEQKPSPSGYKRIPLTDFIQAF